jgi:hypothetical protein
MFKEGDMKDNNQKIDNVIALDSALQTPPDVAISRVIQNMFATYGEDKVRKSLEELFKMKSPKRDKKAA